ncbi:hypothetical protein [Streptodolium elevatio]|uniref:Uncharacterized protein n=1 Tax=Streptodolium elevatio TaxID=3157996 RepID=A0ABV3DTD8_9ACTN
MNRFALNSPQLTAARAWLAAWFWFAARRTVRLGAFLGAIVLASAWADAPRATAFGAGVVCLAVGIVARDACQQIGNLLAPPACTPTADLHSCVPSPCTCGDLPGAATTVRRTN